jgi:hypothetical protein
MESRLNDGSYRETAVVRVKFAEVAASWLAAQIHVNRSTRNRYRGAFSTSTWFPEWCTTPLDRLCFGDISEWRTTSLFPIGRPSLLPQVTEPNCNGHPGWSGRLSTDNRVN